MNNKLDKEFYTIGEVSKIIKVQQHVLRNWEKEIGFLHPRKKQSGHRLYSRQDVQTAMRIRELLYDDLYTLKGAKKRLAREIRKKEEPPPETVIARLKKELKELLAIINNPKGKI